MSSGLAYVPIQCAPVYLIALYWPGLRAGAGLLGVLTGAAIAIAALFSGVTRVEGVHVGVLALVVNLGIAVTGSLLALARQSSSSSIPSPP